MAAKALDFARVSSKYGLSKTTLASLNAFRKRNDDAKKAVHSLQEQKTDVDFAHYRSVLKNQEVVGELEKLYSSFKPVDYDVSAQLKAIDAFEQKAVSSAQEASSKIDNELKQLNGTLSDIEEARPFEDLTLQDIQKARPEVAQTVDTMVSKGKWTVPGYKEKFFDLNAI